MSNETEKQKHARAFRMRAGMVGVLQACLCTYPIEIALTESEHQLWCPAHVTFMSLRQIAGNSTSTTSAEIRTP